jgi:hypothetical protein
MSWYPGKKLGELSRRLRARFGRGELIRGGSITLVVTTKEEMEEFRRRLAETGYRNIWGDEFWWGDPESPEAEKVDRVAIIIIGDTFYRVEEKYGKVLQARPGRPGEFPVVEEVPAIKFTIYSVQEH